MPQTSESLRDNDDLKESLIALPNSKVWKHIEGVVEHKMERIQKDVFSGNISEQEREQAIGMYQGLQYVLELPPILKDRLVRAAKED